MGPRETARGPGAARGKDSALRAKGRAGRGFLLFHPLCRVGLCTGDPHSRSALAAGRSRYVQVTCSGTSGQWGPAGPLPGVCPPWGQSPGPGRPSERRCPQHAQRCPQAPARWANTGPSMNAEEPAPRPERQGLEGGCHRLRHFGARRQRPADTSTRAFWPHTCQRMNLCPLKTMVCVTLWQ